MAMNDPTEIENTQPAEGPGSETHSESKLEKKSSPQVEKAGGDIPCDPHELDNTPEASEPAKKPKGPKTDSHSGVDFWQSEPKKSKNAAPIPPFPPAWIILIVLFLFIVVTTVAIGGILATTRQRSDNGSEQQFVDKQATFLSPPTIPADLPVLQENGAPVAPSLPISLSVGTQIFPITPVLPERGRWPVPIEDGNHAVWIYGTIVNYVVGLPYTTTTAELLSSLQESSRMTLTLSNGTLLVFNSPQSQKFPIDDISPMTQTHPGLTLVMLGESGQERQRQVVRARYMPEESQLNINTQRVGNLQIDILKSGVVGEDAGGSRYFIVEYRITNQGTAPANPALFDISLEDGQGQRYLTNPEASSRGEKGMLIAPIAPGASAEGSAGYLIPRNTQAPLTWIFRPDPTAGTNARFVLPYQPPLPRPAQPNVTLTGAFVDNTRGVIVVNGVIQNQGETALTVNPGDVALTSGTGAAELRASSPNLPWTINGGNEQSFELQFSQPTGVTGFLLNIMGFNFELQSLP